MRTEGTQHHPGPGTLIANSSKTDVPISMNISLGVNHVLLSIDLCDKILPWEK